jgi:hypothetical protein
MNELIFELVGYNERSFGLIGLDPMLGFIMSPQISSIDYVAQLPIPTINGYYLHSKRKIIAVLL